MSRNNNVAGFKEPVYQSSVGMNFLVFVNLTFQQLKSQNQF